MIEGWDHPLCLLDNLEGFLSWKDEVGSKESSRQLTEAMRRHMKKHGTRSVLDVTEKMDDLIARMAEFVDTDELEEATERTHPCCDDPPLPKFKRDDVVIAEGKRAIVMWGASRHEPTPEYPNGYWQYALSEDGTQVRALPNNPYKEDEIQPA